LIKHAKALGKYGVGCIIFLRDNLMTTFEAIVGEGSNNRVKLSALWLMLKIALWLMLSRKMKSIGQEFTTFTYY